jgi:signal transduction histidine kinase
MKAITIEGTTYAEDLNALKKQHNLDFEIEYIPSIENVQQVIEGENGAFGFIDLPIYMTEFNRNSSVRVKRQNLFPVKRIGYSVILPLASDWRVPLEQYFLSQAFQKKRDAIIAKYIDQEVYETIRNLYTSGNEDIFLLTKEKEIQNEALQGKTEQIKRETTLRKYLIGGVGVILIFLLIITRQYMNRHRSALLLQGQKEKIDIQRKAIEVQKSALENRNERLLELNEEKNHLIHILAHDLRSPINQMTGLTEILLMEKERLSSGQVELVNNIQSASTRLSGMITKILDVDGLEKKEGRNTFEPIILSSFVQEVVDRYKPDALKKEIDLKFSPNGSTSIQADPIHLTQVVENILSNALKFSNTGKNVMINIHESSQSIELHICDEGPGFTEEDKKHMFKKFQRLSARPTGSESSTGLGLSIVKKYADLMSAKIEVKSEPGNGSTFVVAFQKS